MTAPDRRRLLTRAQRAVLDTLLRRGTRAFGHLPAAERPLIKHRRGKTQ